MSTPTELDQQFFNRLRETGVFEKSEINELAKAPAGLVRKVVAMCGLHQNAADAVLPIAPVVAEPDAGVVDKQVNAAFIKAVSGDALQRAANRALENAMRDVSVPFVLLQSPDGRPWQLTVRDDGSAAIVPVNPKAVAAKQAPKASKKKAGARTR